MSVDSKDIRKKLRLAFAALQRNGYEARDNFMCCQSCGGAAINLKGKKGGVFWHAQDEDDLRENAHVCIAFLTENGKGTKAVGKALADALRAEGLMVEWNGTAAQRVKVVGKLS